MRRDSIVRLRFLLNNGVNVQSSLGDPPHQPASIVFTLLRNEALALLDQIQNLVVNGVNRFLRRSGVSFRRVLHRVELCECWGSELSEQFAPIVVLIGVGS